MTIEERFEIEKKKRDERLANQPTKIDNQANKSTVEPLYGVTPENARKEAGQIYVEASETIASVLKMLNKEMDIIDNIKKPKIRKTLKDTRNFFKGYNQDALGQIRKLTSCLKGKGKQ